MKSVLRWFGLLLAAALPLSLVAGLLYLHTPTTPDDGGAPDAVAPHVPGWVPNPDAVARVTRGLPEQRFQDTPAYRETGDPGDVFLWEACRKVTGDLLPARDQKSVGSCVSFGTASAIEHLMCVQIALGQAEEFKPLAQEVIYGGSRVQVGKGRIRGDGSVGAWAAQFVRDYGVIARGKHGSYDLSAYSESLCRQFGNQGCPRDLEPLAKEHPVKAITLVKSVDEAKKALANGYPIAVCSNQGFSQSRDADGFARAQGSWAHCMAIVGYQQAPKAGFFILNSWGNRYHQGPVGRGNPSPAGFWAEESVVGRMLSAGDSWAFSSLKGFPSQRIDWFAMPGPPGRPATRLPAPAPGRADREPHLALAP